MNFKFIKHSQIEDHHLKEIVSLKKIHWDYSTEEHTKWIQNNIHEDDIHVLMLDNDILVGYLNLVKIDVLINNISYPFLGIGNVCSKEKRKGYGNELLIEVNKFLIDNHQRGMLFCKDNLIDFYKKFKWQLIDKVLIDQPIFKNINIMLFNFDSSTRFLLYDGKFF